MRCGVDIDLNRELGAMTFVCQSAAMQSLVARAKLVAASDANVLISGECGVGKKALAGLIHEWSRPEGPPLVTIHCGSPACDRNGMAASTRDLSERIKSAAGGTVLLDEVAHLNDAVQQTLLDWLQQSETAAITEYQRPTRFISTTRVELAHLAGESGLRPDLFHRLYVLHLAIPPLRERVEDVHVLAESFLSQIRRQQMISEVALDAAAVEKLQRHAWPGNVRELRNTLFRTCFAASRELIGAADIEASLAPAAVEAPQQYDDLKLADIERRVILRRLDRFHGNKARAAADLGVTDRTLRNKMREYREAGYVK